MRMSGSRRLKASTKEAWIVFLSDKKVARREFLAALFKKPNKPLPLEQGGN